MHRLRNLRLFRTDPDDRHDNQWKHEAALAAFSNLFDGHIYYPSAIITWQIHIGHAPL